MLFENSNWIKPRQNWDHIKYFQNLNLWLGIGWNSKKLSHVTVPLRTNIIVLTFSIMKMCLILLTDRPADQTRSISRPSRPLGGLQGRPRCGGGPPLFSENEAAGAGALGPSPPPPGGREQRPHAAAQVRDCPPGSRGGDQGGGEGRLLLLTRLHPAGAQHRHGGRERVANSVTYF
jgi:hypothetical protein